MQIHLIRHTSVNVPKGICYGATDVPLNDTFESEANVVKQKLSSINFDAVYTSPLTRCSRLAAFCGFNNIKESNNIKELHFGDWEMQKWDDINMSIWANDWITIPTPNGESFEQMVNRVTLFFNELKNNNYRNVAVFCHGGVFCCTNVYLGLLDMKNAFNFKTSYGEIWEFTL